MNDPVSKPFQTIAAFQKSRFSELRVGVVRPANSGSYIAVQRWDRKELGGDLFLRHGNNAGIPPHLWPQVREAMDLAHKIILREETRGAV